MKKLLTFTICLMISLNAFSQDSLEVKSLQLYQKILFEKIDDDLALNQQQLPKAEKILKNRAEQLDSLLTINKLNLDMLISINDEYHKLFKNALNDLDENQQVMFNQLQDEYAKKIRWFINNRHYKLKPEDYHFLF